MLDGTGGNWGGTGVGGGGAAAVTGVEGGAGTTGGKIVTSAVRKVAPDVCTDRGHLFGVARTARLKQRGEGKRGKRAEGTASVHDLESGRAGLDCIEFVSSDIRELPPSSSRKIMADGTLDQ